MTRRFFALLLVAAAGCSGGGDDDDDGGGGASIGVIVGCGDAGCGQSGSLKLPVREATCSAVPLITINVSSVTTSSGETLTRSIDGLVDAATYCVEAWLDTDGSGTQTPGDILTSGDPQSIAAGPAAELTFTLDSIVP